MDPATLARLAGPGTAPSSPQQLGWLYPYDKTVWPRGILAPLLQWQTTANVTAVSIHLSEGSFDFTGTYAGTALVNDPIDQGAWAQATGSNGGEPLVVELRVDDGTTTYGPITESWTIANGVLQGTVYYNSYNSAIINGGLLNGQQVGAVLSIAPGATSPQLAVASTNTGCYVCHTVSADGSTIIMQGPGIRNQDPPTLDQTSVYSLADGGTLETHYSDYGTPNQDKPDWGALYPDGTMFVANSRDGFHAYQGNSDLFPTATAGNGPLPSTGFTSVVTQAVTPAFSPDGRLLAFSFFGGAADAGATAERRADARPDALRLRGGRGQRRAARATATPSRGSRSSTRSPPGGWGGRRFCRETRASSTRPRWCPRAAAAAPTSTRGTARRRRSPG